MIVNVSFSGSVSPSNTLIVKGVSSLVVTLSLSAIGPSFTGVIATFTEPTSSKTLSDIE